METRLKKRKRLNVTLSTVVGSGPNKWTAGCRHTDAEYMINCTDEGCNTWLCKECVVEFFGLIGEEEFPKVEEHNNFFKCANHGLLDLDITDLFPLNMDDTTTTTSTGASETTSTTTKRRKIVDEDDEISNVEDKAQDTDENEDYDLDDVEKKALCHVDLSVDTTDSDTTMKDAPPPKDTAKKPKPKTKPRSQLKKAAGGKTRLVDRWSAMSEAIVNEQPPTQQPLNSHFDAFEEQFYAGAFKAVSDAIADGRIKTHSFRNGLTKGIAHRVRGVVQKAMQTNRNMQLYRLRSARAIQSCLKRLEKPIGKRTNKTAHELVIAAFLPFTASHTAVCKDSLQALKMASDAACIKKSKKQEAKEEEKNQKIKAFKGISELCGLIKQEVQSEKRPKESTMNYGGYGGGLLQSEKRPNESTMNYGGYGGGLSLPNRSTMPTASTMPSALGLNQVTPVSRLNFDRYAYQPNMTPTQQPRLVIPQPGPVAVQQNGETVNISKDLLMKLLSKQ